MNWRANLIIVIVVVLAVGIMLWGRSSAEEKAPPLGGAGRTWMAGVDATIYSDYIWRGLHKYDTSVSPSAYVRFPSFCIKAVGIAETGEDGGMGEVDASFEYFFSVRQLDFSAGYIFYAYDESPYSNTSELFGTVSWKTGTPIYPSLELYWDVDEADALYGRVGVTYADHIESLSYKLMATLGAATDNFPETYFLVSESGLIDFEISFSMTIPVSEQISFRPFGGYSALVNDNIGDLVKDDSNGYGGASIHITF